MISRPLALSLLFTPVFWFPAAQAQTVSATPEDVKAIKALIATHATSGQQDDVEGMVSTQHEDVDERLSDGTLLVGREEVAAFYERVVAGGPKRLAHTHPDETIRIRFLTPEVAFVDVATASMSGKGPRTPFFLLMTKVDGQWGVAVVRTGVPVGQEGSE